MAVAVELAWWEVMDAATCAVRRVVESQRARMKPRGASARLTFDELVASNLVGAAGELAAARVLGVYWPAHVNVNKPGPSDLPPDWEVRARRPDRADLTCTPRDDPDRRYLLVTGTLPTLTVHGWLWGREAMAPQYLRDDDRMPEPLYFAPQHVLHPVEDR